MIDVKVESMSVCMFAADAPGQHAPGNRSDAGVHHRYRHQSDTQSIYIMILHVYIHIYIYIYIYIYMVTLCR